MPNVFKDVFRTTISKTELFTTIVNGRKPLTVGTKSSISVTVTALDAPLKLQL